MCDYRLTESGGVSCIQVTFITKIYHMRIFAPNEVVAKFGFWYFLRYVHLPLAHLASIRLMVVQHPQHVQEIPWSFKVCSCTPHLSGFNMTHGPAPTTCTRNFMISHTDTVKSLHQNMAARHHACSQSIQARHHAHFQSIRVCCTHLGVHPKCNWQCAAGSSHGWNPESSGCSLSIHQAAFCAQSQVPSSPPHVQNPLNFHHQLPSHVLSVIYSQKYEIHNQWYGTCQWNLEWCIHIIGLYMSVQTHSNAFSNGLENLQLAEPQTGPLV